MADLTSSPAPQNEPLAGMDWEGDVRETFYQLYVVEDKTLSKVMEAMELLGFRATERQYKRKITAWRLDKNIKDQEMRAILRVRNGRIAGGKKSVFYVRGRRVDPTKIDRFARRKGHLDSQLPSGRQETFLEDIRCCTPTNDHPDGSRLRNHDSQPGLDIQASKEIYGNLEQSDIGIGHPANLLSSHYQDAEDEDLEPSPERSHINSDAQQPPVSGLQPTHAFLNMHPELDQGPASKPGHKSTNHKRSSGSQGPFTVVSGINSQPDAGHQDELYGIDPGYSDLDLPCNVVFCSTEDAAQGELGDAALPIQYYSQPISLQFSRHLSPFPDALRQEPMDILYFHFFINHTAPLLMVHDCSDNPFRTILPQMALQDPLLLDVMLEYSSVSRARMLKYPVPYKRIARWTRNHPGACNLMGDTKKALARVLLLASLAVLTNEDPTPYLGSRAEDHWQSCLHVARHLILRRPAIYRGGQKDEESCFLVRWFARLDVFGSFSDEEIGPPVPVDAYWPWDGTKNRQVDCLLGTSRFCITILAKIATLVRRPVEPLTDEAAACKCLYAELRMMRSALQEANANRFHERRECSDVQTDNLGFLERGFVDTALHQTGIFLISHYLLRGRELFQVGLHRISPFVTDNVCGSVTEPCMLLPMLIVGVHTEDEWLSSRIMNQLTEMGESGLGRAWKVRHLIKEYRLQKMRVPADGFCEPLSSAQQVIASPQAQLVVNQGQSNLVSTCTDGFKEGLLAANQDHVSRDDDRSIKKRSNVLKFSRTMTDIYADELFEPPSSVQSVPVLSQARQAGNQSQNSLLSPYSGIFSERLQEANQNHISQRSVSPASNASREKSSFREGSCYSNDYSTVATPAARLNSAAQMREKANAESDAIALAQHQPHNDDSIMPRTISRKDALFDYDNTPGNAKMPLLPGEERQKRSKQSHQASTSWMQQRNGVFLGLA